MFCTWYKLWRNKRLANKYGWKPDWFGAWNFDEELIKRIKLFQRAQKLPATGICNKKTYRLILLKILKDISKRKY